MKKFRIIKLFRLGNLIFILLIGAFITLVAMMKNLSGTLEQLSKDIISESLRMTENELKTFFYDIRIDITIEKERGRTGMFNKINIKRFDNYYIPYIEKHSYISSILYANNLGDEYLLLKTDSVWQNRKTTGGSRKEMPVITRWDKNEDGRMVLREQFRSQHYDPRERPWFKGLDSLQSGEIFMTDPYKFFTTNSPGITISVKWKDNKKKGLLHYLAYDILLTDISLFTTGLSKTPNQKIFVLTEDNRLIGLPHEEAFQDIEDMKPYLLKPLTFLGDSVINMAREVYGQTKTDSIITFNVNDKKYWAGARMFDAGSNKTFFIGVIIPESDFLGNIKSTKQLIIGGFGLIFLTMIIMVYGFIEKQRANKIIAMERDKNERLLLNTLPIKVVNDLKTKGTSEPEKFKRVTVFFSDIVGFTKMSSKLDPKKLIDELNDIYTRFDEIVTKNHCERIKTIGDAYMAVCGMPNQDEHHAENILKSAVEIIQYLNERNKDSSLHWKVRIGIHSGTVVGGIVGVKKYIYDVFGDTINTASRMESSSEPMRINISKNTYELIRHSKIVSELKLKFTPREPMEIKGKGLMKMYFVDLKE